MCQKRKKPKGKFKVIVRVRGVGIGLYECLVKTFPNEKSALSWVEKNKIKDYKIENIREVNNNEIYMC